MCFDSIIKYKYVNNENIVNLTDLDRAVQVSETSKNILYKSVLFSKTLYSQSGEVIIYVILSPGKRNERVYGYLLKEEFNEWKIKKRVLCMY